MPQNCIINTEKTDSVVTFLVSEVKQSGEAVISLKSTPVLELLSRIRLQYYSSRIYSHHLVNLWLTGEVSNTGYNAKVKEFN